MNLTRGEYRTPDYPCGGRVKGHPQMSGHKGAVWGQICPDFDLASGIWVDFVRTAYLGSKKSLKIAQKIVRSIAISSSP